jgi:hypothetical protein
MGPKTKNSYASDASSSLVLCYASSAIHHYHYAISSHHNNEFSSVNMFHGCELCSTGVGKLFWVLPQIIFVYNDITP